MNHPSTTTKAPSEHQHIVFTGVDDALDHVIHRLVDLIIAIWVIDCEQPQDAYLEDVATRGGRAVLYCRHLNDYCEPVGDRWTVTADQLTRIHIW